MCVNWDNVPLLLDRTSRAPDDPAVLIAMRVGLCFLALLGLPQAEGLRTRETRARVSVLRGGSDDTAAPCLQAACGDDKPAWWMKSPARSRSALYAARKRVDTLVPKATDALIAGLGLAGSFALMGALEPRIGMKLVVPPMMASGIIFFAGPVPPSPKGFAAGTLGCATISATLFSLLRDRVSVAAAQGAAAGALLVWYKFTSCMFPPAAVLCVLMMSGASSAQAAASFVLKPWLAGHVVLYSSAMGVSMMRRSARIALSRSRLREMHGLTDPELKEIFDK